MFKENSKAIYLQIADRICDDVLAGSLRPSDRLPSVREYAAMVQVNPNTMMRTYDYLSSRGILFNRRGIGYFLAEEAPSIVKALKREEILGQEMNEIFRQLSLLGVTPLQLQQKYQDFLNSNNPE